MTAAAARTVLLTRPAERAGASAERVRAQGFSVLLDPMLGIEVLAADVSAPDAQAILFTSATAVERWAALGGRHDLPAWAVGERTADAARETGFAQVEAGDGFGTHLADRLMAEIDSAKGPLVWPCGQDIAVDLVADLAAVGIQVDRRVLYRSLAATELSAETKQALRDGRVDAVLFYSPKTASVFADLAQAAGIQGGLGRVRALCLSQAVADRLSALSFARLEVASEPSEDALLALLGEQANDGKGMGNPMSDAESEAADVKPHLAAEAVIERFGGLRPMAHKMGVAVSTVQGWKQRGHVPENRWAEVEAAAATYGVDLSGLGAPAAAVPVQEAEPDAPEAPAEQPVEDAAPQATPADDAAMAGKTDAPAGPVTSAATASQPQGKGLAMLALLVGVAAIGAVVTRPAWAPRVDPIVARYLPLPAAQAPAVDSEQLVALQATLDGVTGRVSALEGKPTPTAPDLSPLSARIDALEGALGDLRGKLDALPAAAPDTAPPFDPATVEAWRDSLDALEQDMTALQTKVADLEGKIASVTDGVSAAQSGVDVLKQAREADQAALATTLEALEGKIAAGADAGGRAAALALAIGDLDKALTSGGKADEALQQLRALAGSDADIGPVLARIEPMLANPVPGLEELRHRFAAMAAQIQPPPVDTGVSGVAGDVLTNLMSVISVRRVGDAAELPAAGRAEAALADGDLAGAVAALEGLPDPAGAWVTDAKARLALDDARAELRSLALARLGALAGGGAKP